MSVWETRPSFQHLKTGLGVFVSYLICFFPGVSLANEERGAWSPLSDWPLIAIHAVLTPDGRVMTYGSDQGGYQGAGGVFDVWDPGLGLGPDSHLDAAERNGCRQLLQRPARPAMDGRDPDRRRQHG